MNLLVHFVIYGHSWCFESSQIALAYGSCNFENFQNITRAHESRNALAFIRFPILILQCLVGCSCRKSPAKKAIQVTIYTQYHPEFQNPEEIFMSNWHYTAKTTAKGNLQRTAHSIIQKGASTQRHTRESKIRTKARKSTFFGVVRAF